MDLMLIQTIANANRSNRTLLDSFDVRYRMEIIPPESPQITKIGRYAFSGDKEYNEETLINESSKENSTCIYIRHGSKQWMRQNNSVCVGTVEKACLKPPTPEPWRILDPGVSLRLDNLDEIKHGKIVSIERVTSKGDDYIKIDFTRPLGAPDGTKFYPTGSFWYSVKEGYLPVKFYCSFEDKWITQRTVESSGVVNEIFQCDVQENTVFIPIDCIQEMKRDEKTNTYKYKIDTQSIRINPLLPEDLFEFKIGPNDHVADLDKDGPGPCPSCS